MWEMQQLRRRAGAVDVDLAVRSSTALIMSGDAKHLRRRQSQPYHNRSE